MKSIKELALVSMFAILTLLSASCASIKNDTGEKAVAYIVANHYFVNNGIDRPIQEKIDNAETFNRLFGMAAVMGKNGEPTKIDFSKQFVIAVSDGVTNQLTNYEPVSLVKETGHISFTYKIVKGKHTDYAIRPLLLIVVDKKWDMNVVFKAKKN